MLIASGAFRYCAGFSGTLTIPSRVSTINSQAFQECTGFSRIEIRRATAPIIQTLAFEAMTGVSPAEIHVPVGATGYAASYDGFTVVKDLVL